jgi:putative hydrolase of the HAD superfamily
MSSERPAPARPDPAGASWPVVPAGAAVVLDVDDTLYLERSYVRSGFDAVGQLLRDRHGLEGVARTLWSGFEAGVRRKAFDLALAHHGVEPDAELVAALVGCYRHHRPAIELLPDAARLLRRLGSRAAAAITDGPAPSQRAKVEALGLVRWLDPIVVTGELGDGWAKPSPAAFRHVEEVLGVGPGRCWYVGDNPMKDFVAPLDRGWSAVRIRRPGSLHAGLGTPPGVVEIASLDRLELEPG